ncbi:MAG: leucine-rich repeat protein [Clostridia bacterium]|nr:leucine-rich repeat protein [Clostridia bacterium]
MVEFAKVISLVWPQWQVEKLLGKGSYGRVYQVVRREQGAETRSAVKIISVPPDPAEADNLRAKGMKEDEIVGYYRKIATDFGKEIEMLRAVQASPHVVGLEDYKVVQSRSAAMWFILIRMELLTPFQQYAAEHPLPEREVIRLGIEMCEALEGCHAKNIIHRDIKPQNIFADKNGSFKLGDFGIARRMEGMTVVMPQKGTFGYMAPEVAAGRKYNKKADICSLGLVMYQLANGGKAPFILTAEDQHDPIRRDEAMRRRLSGERLPAPSAASPELARIILKACEYDPEKRIESAAELKSALLRLADQKKIAGNSSGALAVGAVSADVSLREAEKVRKPSETAGGARDGAGPDGANPSARAWKKGGKLPYIAVFAALAVVLIGGLIAVIANLPPRRHARAEEFPVETRADRDAPKPANQAGAETEAPETAPPETEPQETEPPETAVGEAPKHDAQDEVPPVPVPPDGVQFLRVKASGQCGDSLFWILMADPLDDETDELIIYGTGRMWDYQNLYSTGVSYLLIGSPWYLSLERNTRVTFEDGITHIGNNAFNFSSSLIGITLVGELVIPDSVTTIGDRAFSGCSGFDSLTISPSVTTIGEWAFSECSGFTGSLTIPDGVTSIGNDAFSRCNGFTGSLTIPDSVTTIGDYAFSGCSGFTGGVTIGNGLESIGVTVFGSPGLTSIEVSQGNKNFISYHGVLYTADGKTLVECLGGMTVFPEYHPLCEIIGDHAFYDCDGFTGSLAIPNSVTTIGNHAFSGCSGFTGSLTISPSVTTIGNHAFSGCSGFDSLTISPSVTTIGEWAFSECSGFTGSLTISPSVTTIGEWAFVGCDGFTGSLTIPNSVRTIEDHAFSGCRGFTGSVTIGNGLEAIGISVFPDYCPGVTSIEVSQGNKNFISYNGVLYTADGKILVECPAGMTVFPECHPLCEIIRDSAFVGCSSFTGSLTIPNSVTTIGESAFSGCSGFTGSLTISPSVTTIGDFAFYDCSGFTGSLTIPDSVTSIGWRAFSDCSGFTGSLTIPASVTSIGAWAFEDCSGFTGTLTIENSDADIADSAFYRCNFSNYP